MLKSLRLVRFKAFQDSKWIDFKEITLLFGLNSSGKTSILNSLLLLKQSLQNPALEVPVTFSFLADKRGVDLGNYEEVAYNHIANHDQPIELQCKLDLSSRIGGKVKEIDVKEIIFVIRLGFNKKKETNFISGFSILNSQFENILTLKRNPRNLNLSTYHSDVYEDIAKANINTEWFNFLPILKDEKFNDHPVKAITDSIRETLIDVFKNLSHIGPLRSEVERFYQFAGENPVEVGRYGEDALKILYLDRKDNSDDLTRKVNRWFEKYGYRFEWRSYNFGFQLILKDIASDIKVNIKDVGFGISQILPIIVQGYIDKKQIVLIEQPEIHLHPKAQADLADMLIEMQRETGKIFIVETHSEHLLLRLRRRIAETTLNESDSDDCIRNREVAVHFVEKTKKESVVHQLNINQKGEFTHIPDAFHAFFSDDFAESLKLSEAIAKINGKSKS
ncbi:MAG: AAA family ATPase [Bacillota bacterium]